MKARTHRSWMAGAAAAAVLVGVTGSLAQSNDPAAGAGASPRLLPDMVQILPSEVEVAHKVSRKRGRRTLLTFAAAAENHGDGPLIIHASRPNHRTGTMIARQVVAHANEFHEEVDTPVGHVRFVRSQDHRHWHLLDFMRYRLFTESGEPLERDQKTGYCLGDRYRPAGVSFPAQPKFPVYNHQCGRNKRQRLSVTEGISVGFGDVYGAFLEGQYIDITKLPTGNYVLVMRVNPTGRLLDQHRDNDVSSMNVRIVRRGAKTFAKAVRWCSSTNRCPRR